MNHINLVFPIVSTLAFCSLTVGCNREIPLDTSVPGMSDTTTTTQSTTTLATTTTTTTTVTTTEETTETTTTEPTVLDHTMDEIDQIARDLYDQACEKYRGIIIDGSIGLNLYTYVVDQSGRRYYLVDDPSYTTMQDVFQDWHTVFTSDLDTIVETSYITVDDTLYGYTAIQQKNTNYSSTTLTYYYQTDDQLTFRATCNYSSGTKTFEFCIQYFPEDDSWRVCKFTMPY